jgi:hypothetical protein
MKTYKDLFLDQSADVSGTPRRIIKASLKMATADNGSPAGPGQDGSNEDDLSGSGPRPTDQ